MSYVVTAFLVLSATSASAEQAREQLLPAPACADGWALDGKVQLFDKDSLFDRINGESELYFPYGFTQLAYGRYESRKDPKIAVDADVYSLGSLLDAFGMFANYRRKDSTTAEVGVEGVISSSQLLFYQDRYFVRLQVTGTTTIDEAVLLACGKAVSQKLPPVTARPKALSALDVPATVKKTERYIASSLLGYAFFRSGLIADAVIGKDEAQVFFVPESTADAAMAAVESYQAMLRTGGGKVKVAATPGGASLEGTDPLYGNVIIRQSGRFIAGAVRFRDPVAAKQVVEQVLGRAGKE